MATIVRPSRVGFNLTGLREPWQNIDFAWLARQIGAHSVSYLDATETSLRVVCDAEARETAIKLLVGTTKADDRFTARQEVTFTYLEGDMLLIRFADGIPHDMHLLPENSMGIEQVAYGERSIVVKAQKDTSAHAWHRAVQDLWVKLTHSGALPPNSNPYVDVAWPPAADGGQIIVVDSGMVIAESAHTFTMIGDAPFHPPLPAEIIGTRYYAVGAYAEWPPAEPYDQLTPDRVRLYMEIGRMQRGLTGGDFMEMDTPVVFLNTF